MGCCPCGKAKAYQQCCGRYLDQGETPRTAEQLMRSRYTAYFLGGYGQYLLDSWYPATSAGLDVNQLSARSVEWVRLEVLGKSQQGEQAEVEFRAYYLDGDGQEQVMHEVSSFNRVGGQWLYVGGVVH